MYSNPDNDDSNPLMSDAGCLLCSGIVVQLGTSFTLKDLNQDLQKLKNFFQPRHGVNNVLCIVDFVV